VWTVTFLVLTSVTALRIRNRPVGVYETAILTVYNAVLTRVGAKIYALRNARELCFEWRFGENDARTLAYEVAAAAELPGVLKGVNLGASCGKA